MESGKRIGTAEDVELEFFAGGFAEGGGQLHAADVFAGDVVCAALQQQHAVAVFQVANLAGSFKIFGEKSFLSGQHDAEAGERHLVGHYCGNLFECLAVGDHQRRRLLQRCQRRGKLLGLAEECLCVDVHQVAQHLHLWKYHASFRSRRVDGGYQHHSITQRDNVSQQRTTAVGALGQGFFYLCYQRILVDGGFLCQHLQHRCAVLRAPALHHLFGFAIIAFGVEQQRQVDLGQSGHAFLHSHPAQLALVVDAGGVDEHYRPYAANLHALAHGVGGGAGGVAHDGYLLTSQEVNHRALAHVPTAEETNARLQFISFIHAAKVLNKSHMREESYQPCFSPCSFHPLYADFAKN